MEDEYNVIYKKQQLIFSPSIYNRALQSIFFIASVIKKRTAVNENSKGAEIQDQLLGRVKE